jgi:hypothetical protein
MESTDERQTCPCCGNVMATEHAYCRRCGIPRDGPPASSGGQETWTCLTCGRKVPMNHPFCHYCGRPSVIPYNTYPLPFPQPEYHEDSTLVHFILYAISFMVPLLGFVLGFLLTRPDHSPDDRHAGRICILLAFIWPLLAILLLIRILTLA